MRLACVVLLMALLGGCGGGGPGNPPGQTTFIFDFRQGAQGCRTGFSDYPLGQEQFYELESGLRSLPAPLDQNTGILLSGANHSDDLFMFLTGHLSGLRPDQNYSFQFQVEFASNAPSGCTGAGGSPGESVTVKAGASSLEPQAEAASGYYQMNVDKGNQGVGGKDAIVIGNIANGTADCSDSSYVMKTLQTTMGSFAAKTDSQGSIWILVGTDSGFEGTTALYYAKIIVTVQPR